LRPMLVLVLSGLVLAACGRGTEDASLPEGCDGVTWGSSIQVEEGPEGYTLLIEGNYPDSCSTVCGHVQTVEGNEINIDLFSTKPEGAVCAQMLTPFEIEVALDTEGLDPGEYTVTLNGDHAQTTFTLR
jgi:hypothetical protein